MEVVTAPIGSEGKVEVDVVGGKLVLKMTHMHASGSIMVEATEDLKYFLELLKPKLPAWAQIGIGVVEGALP